MGSPLGSRVRDATQPVSMSDRSGFLYNTCDMVKQMEWRGNKLQWTGLMVGHDEVDTPNQNLKPFKSRIEGVPPPNTRPYKVNGTSPPYYGPEMSYQETLQQLMDYNPNDNL